MIVEVLRGLAVADGAAAIVFAGLIYVIGRRTGHPVGLGRSVGLAVLLGLPAILLYLTAVLLSRVV